MRVWFGASLHPFDYRADLRSIEVGPASDAATVRALGSLPLVLEPAAAVVSVDADTLARNVEFRTVEGTRLVTIRARAASAATALTAAEAVANSLIAASGPNAESRGRILGPARLASAPTTPWSRATRGALSGVAIAAAVVALLTTPRASPPDGEAIGNPR